MWRRHSKCLALWHRLRLREPLGNFDEEFFDIESGLRGGFHVDESVVLGVLCRFVLVHGPAGLLVAFVARDGDLHDGGMGERNGRLI